MWGLVAVVGTVGYIADYLCVWSMEYGLVQAEAEAEMEMEM